MANRTILELFMIISIYALAHLTAYSQHHQSEGVRTIFHPSISITTKSYITVWTIANMRSELPDNRNVFAGVGYELKHGYMEGMFWQQWTKTNKTSALDFRLQHKGIYLELSPFLSKRGLYNFLIVEHPLSKHLSVGGETENVNTAGKKDSLGGGPRASTVLYKNQNLKLVLAGSYQFRNDNNTARIYVIVHFRIPRRK